MFEGGRIIETGTFEDLVRLGGHFAKLARTQFMVPDTRVAEPPAKGTLVET